MLTLKLVLVPEQLRVLSATTAVVVGVVVVGAVAGSGTNDSGRPDCVRANS